MSKIVREHYPASKLPEDLREGIDPAGKVTVTVVEEQQPVNQEELARLVEQALQHAQLVGGVTTEEAVGRIRALREEWNT
jgi:hypothetical protein